MSPTLSAIESLALALLALTLGACSIRQLAVNEFATVVVREGAFSRDDDPELIRAAAPFSLKLLESLLAESPDHEGLLLAAARGFTQYAYAFLQQDSEEAEENDFARALLLEGRARGLYRRGRDYGLRGLARGRPDFVGQLRADPRRAVSSVSIPDVPLLYWTGASWGALIGLSKDTPEAIADLPIVEAIVDRALDLDESFGRGALHTFMISFESTRSGGKGDPSLRAREHFRRARELSGGTDAAPLLALAEAVCVPQQRRAEFESLLRQALEIDIDRDKEIRLANVVAQHRARWLLSRSERLFTR
jgi:predicted anti-sigma-YlaC factor YlaD